MNKKKNKFYFYMLLEVGGVSAYRYVQKQKENIFDGVSFFLLLLNIMLAVAVVMRIGHFF